MGKCRIVPWLVQFQSKFQTLSLGQEEEEDMLDLAWGLEDNSRLGCQIEMKQELDGCTFTIPEE